MNFCSGIIAKTVLRHHRTGEVLFLKYPGKDSGLGRMIRPLLYDMLFGLPLEVATPNLYRIFLNHIEENSKVLEVGIGTGLTLEKNADIIKSKNIQIHGIDVDDSYLTACRLKIAKTDLHNHVTLELNNILDVELTVNHYDYVLFMESYPVIPRESLELIVRRLQRIVKPSGRITFIHNLIEKNEWSIGRALIKTNLKKVTTIDFGRLIVRADFEKWCIDAGLQLDSMQMIGELNLPFPPCNSIRQYMYFWKSMYKNGTAR